MNYEEFVKKLGNCEKCTNLGKCSLINYYKNLEFALSIPSIWTDWVNRQNSNIMIIGQDWGPFEDMKYFYDRLNKNKSNWNEVIEEERSLTKRKLTNFLIVSSKGKIDNLDNIYITNAIKCARTGSSYRGDNINLTKSTINCHEYLLDEINMVKPKIIFTLGYYPLLALSKIYNFSISSSLKENINEVYQINGITIIPGYHPVAQIKTEDQIKQYQKIWEYLEENEVVKHVRDNS